MLTVAQAAARIGVSPSTLYGLVAARRIAHYRVGGKIVLADADVDAYLAGCRVGVAAAAPGPPRPVPALKHLRL